MADLDKNEKNWLIKSSSKILGPFSAIEVAQGVIKKNISIIDEARVPQMRWAYIRENSIFSEVVQSLRYEQSTHVEETVTTAQNTQTLSRTDWQNTEIGTPTPPFLNVDRAEDGLGKIKDVTPAINPLQNSLLKAATSIPSFGTTGDQRVKSQLEITSKNYSTIIWAVTLLITITISLVIFKKFRGEGKSYEKNIRQAVHFNHILLFEKAVDSFHRAQEAREPDQATSFQLVLPLLQADHHSLWSRKVIETELIRPGLTRQENADALLGIGLSYVIDGDLKKAQDFYNKTLATDPENYPANIDLAFNYLKKGDYGLAAKIFTSLQSSNAYRPYILYGVAALAAESQNYSHKELQKELKDYLQNVQPLRKEIGLILAFLQMTDKNIEGLNSTMETLVKIPLQESTDFVFDPRIDRRIIDWDYLEHYCQQIFQNHGASALAKSFRAMCLLEENREVEAKKWIEEALAQEPKDTISNLVHVHFLMKTRHWREAASLLKSPILEKLTVAPLLLGKVCQDLNETTCAQENFKKAYQQNSEDVVRIQFLARTGMGKDKEHLAKTWELVKKGLELQPQYKPLIELRDQLENE